MEDSGAALLVGIFRKARLRIQLPVRFEADSLCHLPKAQHHAVKIEGT